MRAPRSPTLRQLAADLGLDAATVSRGLRDSPRVAAATRERIQRRAEALGYRPDPALARLSHHRWAGRRRPSALNLAFLTRRQERPQGGFLSHATAMAERLGYALRAVPVQEFADAAALQDFLLSGGMEGLLFGHIDELPQLPQLDWSRFAVVGCGSVGFSHPFHCVMVDTFAQMELALDRMHAAGHRRIGVVHHPLILINDHRRLAAYDAARRRLRLPAIPPLMVPHQVDTDLRARCGRWLQRHRPQALVLPGARIARALLPERAGRPPCVLLSEQGDTRGFAHVRIDLPAVGRLAVQQLSHALHHRLLDVPEQAVASLVRPVWVPGASLAS
ncbi:MAG: LacI family DNA-binding transcriptional regulator [Planctomycetota bacterium]